MKLISLILTMLLILSTSALARPVSYPTGVTLIQMNSANRNSLLIHYSPTIKYSLGYRGEYWRDEERQFHGAQLNYLAKRWNQPSLQANFYIKSGVGAIEQSTTGGKLAAFTGFAWDWEDRRYFTSYENRYFDGEGIQAFFTQKARLGVAPYLGDYGDLHTWLMLQVDHDTQRDDSVHITPLIRLFKKEYLAELGINEHGDALLNLIIRF